MNDQKNGKDIKSYSDAAISIDCVIFGYDSPRLKILTMNSIVDSFGDLPALVGDLVGHHETLEDAAKRILRFRTGLQNVHMQQVKSFGAPNRHPLGRVVTVAFYALLNVTDVQIEDTREHHPRWSDINDITKMAFDHADILRESLALLRRRFFSDQLYSNLLPELFTLSDLQILSEQVLQKEFDKRNFRKKILNQDQLIDTEEYQKHVNHRPAKLYRLKNQIGRVK